MFYKMHKCNKGSFLMTRRSISSGFVLRLKKGMPLMQHSLPKTVFLTLAFPTVKAGLRILRIICGAHRLGKLICAGRGPMPANIPGELSLNLLHRPSVHQIRDCLQIAVAAAQKMNIADNIAVNVQANHLRAGVFRFIIVTHSDTSLIFLPITNHCMLIFLSVNIHFLRLPQKAAVWPFACTVTAKTHAPGAHPGGLKSHS